MMYVGIPYKKGGRTAEGCDCFGLFLLYYKNELGIDFPDYTDAGISSLADSFRRVETPRLHDVLVFNFNGERHVGVALSSTRFLHNISRADAVISRIADYSEYITGVYRYAHTDNK